MVGGRWSSAEHIETRTTGRRHLDEIATTLALWPLCSSADLYGTPVLMYIGATALLVDDIVDVSFSTFKIAIFVNHLVFHVIFFLGASWALL